MSTRNQQTLGHPVSHSETSKSYAREYKLEKCISIVKTNCTKTAKRSSINTKDHKWLSYRRTKDLHCIFNYYMCSMENKLLAWHTEIQWLQEAAGSSKLD